MTSNELFNKAIDLRCKLFDMSLKAGSGHFGGSLSCMDILTVLYYDELNIRPGEPDWEGRDRFVLSKGHALLGLASVLKDKGYFPEEFTDNYNGYESAFGMHPNMHYIPGIDMSTGSLGHGLSVAGGMAITAKLDHVWWRVYALLGDGECDEGMVWEAAMSAAHYKLDNLIAFVDRNKLSLDGTTEEVMGLEPFADKWRAFGWNVIEIDGHDVDQILKALKDAKEAKCKPSVIIASTIKGKGAELMEGKTDWHYGGLDSETVEEIKAGLQKQRRA
jgi:transketolase